MGLSRCGFVLACLALGGLVPDPSAGQAAAPNPSRLVLKYDAGLAGLTLGEFKLIANFAGDAYDMRAHGSFSLLAGLAFKATGETTSIGTLTEASPRPARFTMKYNGGKKREKRRIDFTEGAVSSVSLVPQKKRRNRRAVPISEEQLQDVLDPLTAAFLSVRSDAPAGDVSVCKGTIPVFEGKQRFNIKLSPKRSEQLDKRAPRAFSGRAAVCQVRYEPVAGHRPDNPGVQFMSQTEDIEAWLVPVPRTDLYVPYKILVPTAWGMGSIMLSGIRVKSNAPQRASAP
jgi:hypothetical protein